ncbi:hypothetical protein AB0B66_33800 [Catellatospora sp. NPDC049111]|uniref:hypothetical protein n=1 Tax=Catellatospora sp. NPDC049111 TaxID=3155271 RepID=UPI0033F0B4C5
MSVVAVTILLVALSATVLATRARTFKPPGEGIRFDEAAVTIIARATAHRPVRLIAIKPTGRDLSPGGHAEAPQAHYAEAIFLEVTVARAHRGVYHVHGEHYSGYRILTVTGSSAGRAVAAVLLGIRDVTGHVPSVDFSWPTRGHARHLLRFLLLGVGQVAPATREILRRAEADSARRPKVHVGP